MLTVTNDGIADVLSYESVVEAVMEGPVQASDFWGTEGATNWILLDDGDAPSGRGIYSMRILRIFADTNKVRILIFDREHPLGIAMDLDADELALRIEAT